MYVHRHVHVRYYSYLSWMSKNFLLVPFYNKKMLLTFKKKLFLSLSLSVTYQFYSAYVFFLNCSLWIWSEKSNS